jgi:hypothetical protein
LLLLIYSSPWLVTNEGKKKEKKRKKKGGNLWKCLENRCSPETGELACSSGLQVGSGDGGASCKPSPLWILEKALSLKLLPQGDSLSSNGNCLQCYLI